MNSSKFIKEVVVEVKSRNNSISDNAITAALVSYLATNTNLCLFVSAFPNSYDIDLGASQYDNGNEYSLGMIAGFNDGCGFYHNRIISNFANHILDYIEINRINLL